MADGNVWKKDRYGMQGKRALCMPVLFLKGEKDGGRQGDTAA